MRNLKILLILVTLLFLGTACSTTQKIVPIIERVPIEPCPMPSEPPILYTLDYDYLESINGNAEKIMKNRLIIDNYIKVLYGVIKCYEEQIIIYDNE